MENDDFLKDDFLRELINRTPLDSPSDDFVDRVMAKIQLSPEAEVVKKPYSLLVKSALPYVGITLFLFIVIATSDLPIFRWFPGKDYLVNNFLSYFGTLLSVFKNAFASKFVSWGLMISFSAGVLFLVDRLFSRHSSV